MLKHAGSIEALSDFQSRAAIMRDELFVEEMSLRETQEKMDEAFRAAMQRAIDAGEENTPTAVSKKPGTRNPKIMFAFRT
jgi:hypothetical protein